MVYGGGVRKPQKVVFFNAILIDVKYENIIDDYLNSIFGSPKIVSEKFSFSHTSYYEKEMGNNLVKYFACYDIIDYPDKLVNYKRIAVDIEDFFKENGKRKVNIDPGYVAMEKVVAASTKNFTHRIYLGESIYADLQLYRKKKSYVALPWTFYDYQTSNALIFFEKCRIFLEEKLNAN
ncbi:DUF4416 family protein [Deferribacter autotrophicus]|uniref:DUF4416 family protein n=1 Tax=Deferribacter autotrophicus TaxID=500465 RepID=A0A5A8F6P4_9BACT|nr:DUF4416 family protein [Deferribacter autotrophicus]KAA0259325.1 DUF4416 family protein [Deferribacter autotrophicus]